MNKDIFLKIGCSHTICQDYILTGDVPCEYIVLADGCSQAEDSDIGARILCHQAVIYLKRNWERLGEIDPEEMGDSIIEEAGYVASTHFNVNLDCLDATLIVAFKHKGEYRIIVYGDGCIWFVSKTGEIDYYNISYKPNAPYYLRYRLKGTVDYLSNKIVRCIETPHGTLEEEDRVTKPFDLRCSEDEIRMIMIASDGIESFMFKEEVMYKTLYLDLLSKGKRTTSFLKMKEFSFKEVCEDFTEFKLLKGPFLSRRVKRVMKEYLKLGFVNDDDLSIGCFYEE